MLDGNPDTLLGTKHIDFGMPEGYYDFWRMNVSSLGISTNELFFVALTVDNDNTSFGISVDHYDDYTLIHDGITWQPIDGTFLVWPCVRYQDGTTTIINSDVEFERMTAISKGRYKNVQ